MNTLSVLIGDMIVSNDPDDILVAHGLGSCVAVCLYDPVMRVGGMLHALLPNAPDQDENVTKYIDTGTVALMDELIHRGVRRSKVIAYLFGGASMLDIPGENIMNIGERNAATAKLILQEMGIPIEASIVGGHKGRTVRFMIEDGSARVRSIGETEQVIKF